jgi:crotonobetainyl-CoA:carnitine CoA-transferase CaiB-like acyl-CoA transferase
MTPRASGGRVVVNPLVGTYRTKDRRHVMLVFLESDRYWPAFCALVGRPDLAEDARFADHHSRGEHAQECAAELDELFAQRTLEEWKALLGRIDAPWAPMQAVEELLDDPQVVANDYLGDVALPDGSSYRLPRVPVQFDERPPDLQRAPEHGEHTEAVLLELGYSWDDISRFGEASVIP